MHIYLFKYEQIILVCGHLMIDKVEVSKPITIDEKQSQNWAQEQTLRELNAKMGRNNEILRRLGSKWNVDLDNIKETDSIVRNNNQAVTQNTVGIRDNTKKYQEATENYSRAVDDLRYSMRNYKNSVNDLIAGGTDPLRRLPEVAESLGTGLAGLAGRSVALARVFVGLGLAASLVIDRFLQGGEAFRGMIQSGVLFDGSIIGMTASVRSAGLTLEQGARLVSQYGQAMIVQGETRFFRSMEGLARTFANLGMDMSQGSEAMLELMELQRMSGELFMMSERDRIAANVQSLQLMQAEAVLTGQSVQRQREQQRRIQESQRLQILQATLTPQQLAQQRLASVQLGRMGIPTEVIEGILMESITGAATRVSGQARLSYGPVVDEIIQQIRSGQAGEVGGLAQRERLLSYQERLLQGGAAAALAYGQRGQDFVAQIAPVLQMGRQALRGAPDSEAELRTRQERAGAIARGEQVLADQTVNLYNTQNQLAQAAGRAEAALMRLAEHAINPLISSMSSLSTSINALAGASTMGGAGTAIMGMLQNPLAQAALAGGVGYVGLRMFRGRNAALPGLATAPAVPGMAAPGAGGGLAARLAGLGRFAGGAGGVLGAGLGAYTAATGATQQERQMGILAAMGSGALTGGMIGGTMGMGVATVPGMLIGGALGAAGAGITALLANLYGTREGAPGTTPATAATTTPDITLLQNTLGRLDYSMGQVASYLAPGGNIERKLNEIGADIVRAVRESN